MGGQTTVQETSKPLKLRYAFAVVCVVLGLGGMLTAEAIQDTVSMHTYRDVSGGSLLLVVVSAGYMVWVRLLMWWHHG